MQNVIRRAVTAFPMLRSLFRPAYYKYIQRLPPIYTEGISDSDLRGCITKESPCILEIGANNGAHTMKFKRMFPSCEIHCFEPDSRAIQSFRQRTAGTEGIYLHEVAIGAKTGTVNFFPSLADTSKSDDRRWDLSGSLREPTGHINQYPSITFGPPVAVSAMRLDEWSAAAGIEEVDFIWMDVQGAEMDVFSGGRETLARTKFLYTEYSMEELYAGQASLVDILHALKNFETVKRFPKDILLRNKFLD